jgi:caffeoyl-CoA O-methyltransferase
MQFPDPLINQYAETHSTPEAEILAELNRETHLKMLMPQMLSGHLQGNILKMFSRMIKPYGILEIGTFTGYSSICLASGLAHDGFLITIDINEELKLMAEKYFEKAGLQHKIEMRTGDATEIIPTLKDNFDLVFIDADKLNYSNYYDLVFDKVNPGGFILADNVLWSGKVLEQNTGNDKDTQAIKDFNKKVLNDNRVESVILPVRDGINVIWKK